ncbi:MAG TPA: AbrB/MazE/SpoVT family DNA-binding domain-containing protein [Candidatus Angelobacter sp.]|jgi:putative addiction module antidote
MMAVLKLTLAEGSTGIALPKEMFQRLHVNEGETVFALETPDGYLLTGSDPEVERQLEIAREVMAEYRETLRALAK